MIHGSVRIRSMPLYLDPLTIQRESLRISWTVSDCFWPISALRVCREAASSVQMMGLRKLGLFTPHISDLVHLLQGFGSG